MPRKIPDVQHLEVWLGNQKVGTLAQIRRGPVAFAYDPVWLHNGFSLNPFSCLWNPKVFIPDIQTNLSGLFGVFYDSLLDGWGARITNALLEEEGIDSESGTPLTRLALLSSSSTGALSYQPALSSPFPAKSSIKKSRTKQKLSLEETANEIQKLMNQEESDHLDAFYQSASTTSGSRPKTLWNNDGEEWIVKFRHPHDPADIAQQEFAYMECARLCKIEVPEHRLIPSKDGGYYSQ